MSNPIEDREPPVISPSGEMVEGMERPLQGGASGPVEFQCKVCGQVFTNQADLSEHMLSHERTREKFDGEKQPAGIG
jgi:hypothetical protein